VIKCELYRTVSLISYVKTDIVRSVKQN